MRMRSRREPVSRCAELVLLDLSVVVFWFGFGLVVRFVYKHLDEVHFVSGIGTRSQRAVLLLVNHLDLLLEGRSCVTLTSLSQLSLAREGILSRGGHAESLLHGFEQFFSESQH